MIEDVLPLQGLIALYSRPGAGKSMFALSAALAVARGERFMGKEVERGCVIYCALEGRAAFQNRVAAYCEHHRLSPADDLENFYLLNQSLDLRSNSLSAGQLIELVGYLNELSPAVPVRLIVIDTLSQAFAGGNENSPEDMGAFIAQIQAIVRRTGAAVMIVHHCGKDRTAGMRGHSSLLAAVDTELQISRRSEIGTLRVTKQRDGEDQQAFTFKLESVTLGRSPKGREVTSAVFVPVGEEVADGVPKPRGKIQCLLIEALKELVKTDSTATDGGLREPRDWASEEDVVEHALLLSQRRKLDARKDNLVRSLETLIERELIKSDGNRLYLK